MATTQTKQALRDNRKKQGLCIYCGDPADSGTRCTRCTEKDKENRKRRALRDEKRGICKNTGCSNKVSEGHKYCDACNRRATTNTGKRRQKHLTAGLCADCGKCPPVQGITRCEKCNKRLLQSIRKLTKQRETAGKCGRCGDNVLAPGYKRCQPCIDEARQRHQRLKHEVLAAYGGEKCQGCNEAEFWILQIDHINGGGNKHATIVGNGDREKGRAHMYKWLKENGFPSGFRVLCANCNIKAYHHIPLPNEIKT
jgi:hypothetical protein